MGFFIDAFNLIIYQPLFNALVLLYLYLPGRDFGIAVIVLTVLIKLALYPLAKKGIQSQRALQKLQPKIKEIRLKFKNDKEKQARAMMELYQKEKVNPFSGFLLLLIQLPILLGLFRVFWKGFGPEQVHLIYRFVPEVGPIDTAFLGIVDLAQASVVLALIVGVLQFVQAKMLSSTSYSQNEKSRGSSSAKTPDFAAMIQKQMLYFFPVFTVFILWYLPSAIALYWLTTTLFTIGQQYITLKKELRQKNKTEKQCSLI